MKYELIHIQGKLAPKQIVWQLIMTKKQIYFLNCVAFSSNSVPNQ